VVAGIAVVALFAVGLAIGAHDFNDGTPED